MAIEIRPVSPVLGAEVRGVDADQPIDDETFAEVHQAFLAHGVLFFRDQRQLSPGAQVAFADRFGPLHTHPAAPTLDDSGAVFVIHTHRDSPVANGNGWHTDVSCDERPPMATTLQMHVLPDRGGDTLFADTAAAYAALPAEQRARLVGLDAIHESEHVYRGRYSDRGVDDDATDYPRAVHPVVRLHPETGRPSLYVNPSFTTSIVGWDQTESDALLESLFRHQQKPEFQIRFTWQENDIALWDNRHLLHFAVWDYWPQERIGHRVSLLGDRPIRASADAPTIDVSALKVSIGRLA